MAAVEARVCETAGCSSEAKLQCPTCIKLGIQGSYFCSQVNRRCSGRPLPANGRGGGKLRPQRFPRRALGPSGAPAAPARLPVGLETGGSGTRGMPAPGDMCDGCCPAKAGVSQAGWARACSLAARARFAGKRGTEFRGTSWCCRDFCISASKGLSLFLSFKFAFFLWLLLRGEKALSFNLKFDNRAKDYNVHSSQ